MAACLCLALHSLLVTASTDPVVPSIMGDLPTLKREIPLWASVSSSIRLCCGTWWDATRWALHTFVAWSL